MIRADKRWRDGRSVWRTPDGVFNPRNYAVDVILDDTTPKRFVNQHHYSGSYPAARFRVGLFGPRAELAGVAVFSVSYPHVIAAHLGGTSEQGAELGRFVCLPSVLFNGETWFLARAFRFVREEKGVDGIVSYADPLERRTAAGELYKRQHWGTIYQASNALYVGRSSPRTLLLAPNGTVISGRALTKIRKEERGWEYATRQLLALGAPAREFGEAPSTWVRRVERAPGFARVRHNGNLTYLFGLTRAARSRIDELHGSGLRYEKQERAA